MSSSSENCGTLQHSITELLMIFRQRGDFNEGGKIDRRRLRMLPLLLDMTNQVDEYERFLADLQHIEMQVSVAAHVQRHGFWH